MNDTEFLSNFGFREFIMNGTHTRDNTHGVDRHFIGYMKLGRGVMVSDTKTVEVFANDLFYIPKGCKYRSTWIGDSVVRFDSIGFNYFPTGNASGYELQKIEYNKQIYSFYQTLSENKELCCASIGKLYTLLGMLEPLLEKSLASKPSDTVQKAIALMYKDHMRSIPEYALDCGVSESLLYLYFKEYANESPNTARQRIACEKAINLLTSSTLSIEEICSRTGFSSSSYFRKVLYSITNKTPTEIRKSASRI